MPKKTRGKKVTFLYNMAAVRGEKTPLKIFKIFSIHFFDITNPHTNFQLSKIRNGEKKVSDYCVPLSVHSVIVPLVLLDGSHLGLLI